LNPGAEAEEFHAVLVAIVLNFYNNPLVFFDGIPAS
jgi:hypothetical protein